MISTELFISILSLTLMIVIQTLLIIKYLLNVTNDGDRELHMRIDEIKDGYVKRSELDRDLKNINNTLTLIRSDFKQGLQEIKSSQDEDMNRLTKRFDIFTGNMLRVSKGKDQ